jgi:hypothetical protein
VMKFLYRCEAASPMMMKFLATASSGAVSRIWRGRQRGSDQAKDEFETVLDLCHPIF